MAAELNTEVRLEVSTDKKYSRHVNHTMHMTFRDLSVRADGKFILQNITGEIKPGEIIAIMGPSG